jgi:hypothetical protein
MEMKPTDVCAARGGITFLPPYSFANCEMKIVILPKQIHVIDRFAFFESSFGHISIKGSDDRLVFDHKSFPIDK